MRSSATVTPFLPPASDGTQARPLRIRNLHDETDGFRMPADYISGTAPRSLESLGTTARTAESHEISAAALLGVTPAWLADLEYVWRSRVAGVVTSLDERAKRRQKQAAMAVQMFGGRATGVSVAFKRSAEWAEHRSRALAMARGDVIGTCGKRWRAVRCGCKLVELRVGCEQPALCVACRKRHWNAWRKRITEAMDHALRDERKKFYTTPAYRRRGFKPGIYLITLTGPHSGDLATDRERMGKAVRKLLKEANRERWWSTYALTWEATAGTDGHGHMHAHLAVISSWVPYTAAQGAGPRGLRDVWADAMPGAMVLDVKPPRTGSDEAAIGAQYLAKYVTKGIEPGVFTGRKAGELLIAFRSKRKVTTSAGFWRPPLSDCPDCGQPWCSMGAPVGLQQLAPGAVLRSMAERAGYFIPRGHPQVDLRWEGG